MIECINYRSHLKGHLLGFADLRIEKWGIDIFGCTLFQKDGRRWINLPGREYLNQEGEKKHLPFLRFKDPEHYRIFMDKAKEAIDKWIEANQAEQPIHQDQYQDELPF